MQSAALIPLLSTAQWNKLRPLNKATLHISESLFVFLSPFKVRVRPTCWRSWNCPIAKRKCFSLFGHGCCSGAVWGFLMLPNKDSASFPIYLGPAILTARIIESLFTTVRLNVTDPSTLAVCYETKWRIFAVHFHLWSMGDIDIFAYISQNSGKIITSFFGHLALISLHDFWKKNMFNKA